MGETFVGLVRNIPTRVPSALVVRTHLADLVYTLFCSHLRSSLADGSRFHMKIFWGVRAGFDEYPLPDPTRTFILLPEPDPTYF